MLTAPRRHARLRAALLVVTLGLGALALGPLPTAGAAECEGGKGCPTAAGEASGGTISVTVTGSATRSSGSFSTGPTVVSAPAVCWYTLSDSGADFYAAWQPDGKYGSVWNYYSTPFTGMVVSDAELEAHKDDTAGRWAYPTCEHSNFRGEPGTWGDFWEDYMATHGMVFVPEGQEPPAPEVAVETLRDIARNALTLPPPTVGWNPKLQGNAATIVNFDTWVWLEDPTTSFYVTATAGANSATVDATLRDMTLSAPSADDVTCAGAGTPWSPGASSDCSIVFTRSSASEPGLKTTLSISTGWDTTWSANGVPRGALDGQVMTSQAQIPVAEVQTIITKN